MIDRYQPNGLKKNDPSYFKLEILLMSYARKAKLHITWHHLRHTMAAQLLNADADLCAIQDLLGHSNIKTTQCYCRVSNLKVQGDYFNAMDLIMQRTVSKPDNFVYNQ